MSWILGSFNLIYCQFRRRELLTLVELGLNSESSWIRYVCFFRMNKCVGLVVDNHDNVVINQSFTVCESYSLTDKQVQMYFPILHLNICVYVESVNMQETTNCWIFILRNMMFSPCLLTVFSLIQSRLRVMIISLFVLLK